MKFTIFRRLTLGYSVTMLLVIFLVGFITIKLNRLNDLIWDIHRIDGKTIRLAEDFLDTFYTQIAFEKKYIISKDYDFFKQFEDIKKYVKENITRLAVLMDSPEKKRLIVEAEALNDRYHRIFTEEAGLIKKGLEYPLEEYRAQKDKLIEFINIKFGEIIRVARASEDIKIVESYRISEQVLRVTAIAALITILAGIIISFLNTRSINRSIVLLREKTKEIAQGKFEEIPRIASPPEIKELADDFNFMCERLKELDEMKIDFIAHVSHELRTPLTAIKEASTMLQEGVYANSPQKEQELLTIIHEECERLIESVNRILDLARMEAKMMVYHIGDYRLDALIQRSVLKLNPVAVRKKINIELKLAQDLPTVNIDEGRIEQVLENLLGNALKFTMEKGNITIQAAANKNSGKFVEISIADTGSGIAGQDLEKIFDKFQRVENGKGTVRGTGLGLPIAKHIITAHGGEIWAKSQPEAGSTFCFTLPVSKSSC